MIEYGADSVVVVEHRELNFIRLMHTQALLQVIEIEKPDGIIMGHTAIGKDISPRIAAKLYSGLFQM